MQVKVQWIIDGLIEIDAESNEAAEAIADEKLRSFIAKHPELTEALGAVPDTGLRLVCQPLFAFAIFSKNIDGTIELNRVGGFAVADGR